jgi:hypothetical protein
MIFLPGLDHRTAEYASKRIGQATVWQSASVDVKEGTKFDSERTSEVGRSLMDASEVRRMVKYRQAVAIIGNAPPVRFSYPPIYQLFKDSQINKPQLRVLGETIGQRDGNSCGERRPLALESGADGFHQHCAIKIEGLRKKPQIEIVLHPAIADPTLFGDLEEPVVNRSRQVGHIALFQSSASR